MHPKQAHPYVEVDKLEIMNKVRIRFVICESKLSTFMGGKDCDLYAYTPPLDSLMYI